MSEATRARAAPLLLFVAFAALYCLTALGRIDSFDGEIMFRVTESLIERGSLRITDEVFHANEPYSVYGLGTSIAASPLYVVARVARVDPRWAISLFNPLAGAMTVALFYAFGRRLGYGAGLALLLSGGLGLGSLLWPYTKTFFSEPLIGLLLLAAAAAAYEARRGSERAHWLVGLALGFAVLTREDTVAALPLYAAYLLWPRGRSPLTIRAVVAGLVPLALLLGLTVWYHELRYQSLFSGYSEKTGNAFLWTVSSFVTGLFGQTLSPGKGLLFYTPLVLVAPFVWATFWRRFPLECALFTALIVERLVLFSLFSRWYAGVCWGPRYLVPAIPMLLLPIGLALVEPGGSLAARRLVVLLIGLASVVAQLPGVAIFYTDYLYALDELKITWEQIFFEPRWSPLLGQLRWVLQGRNVAWLLPIDRPELVLPVGLALGSIAALALAGLAYFAPPTPGRGLMRPVTNALSVDLEGFVESNRESFSIPSADGDPVRESREIERNTDATLALFDRLGVKATFFIVARIARDLPAVVRAVAAAGHEVGCHNFEHRRIFGLTEATFREGMRRGLGDLQDVAGQPVVGFRAPDFSITRDSLWALDVLRDVGLTYDSSIYPIRGHDVYGIADVQPWIHRLPNGLVEFPLSTIALAGRRLPFGGGGYFRLYPVWLTSLLARLVNRGGRPFMLYIHPYEVGPDIPRIGELSRARRFRHYHNTRNGAARLGDLLGRHRFAPVRDVLQENGFAV